MGDHGAAPELFGPAFDADPYPAYEWLRRLPDLRLSVPEAELRWWPSQIMRGLFSLPVFFRPVQIT